MTRAGERGSAASRAVATALAAARSVNAACSRLWNCEPALRSLRTKDSCAIEERAETFRREQLAPALVEYAQRLNETGDRFSPYST